MNDTSNKHVCITVIGNPGTGKSTLAKWLSKKLGAKFLEADSLFEVNPFFPLAVENRARWSLASDIWFLQERVKLYKAKTALLQKAHLVIDSGIPMSYVYAHSRLASGFFTQDEWELYQSLFDTFTADVVPSDIIIYLQLPIHLQRQSIIQRGREFEITHHTEEYLQSLQNSLETVVSMCKKRGIHIIEHDAMGQVLTQEFLTKVQSIINSK